MRGIILALTLAIVVLKFPDKKTYRYKYEGMVMIGVSENGLVRTGVKITSSVDITEISQNIYLMQLVNPLIQEYNGVWPNAPFISVAKLNQALEPQLVQPVRFEYNNGQVGQIFTPASVSNTVVNIHRGILSMLQLTIKSTRTVYQLQEPGIAGTCHTNYVLQQHSVSDQIIITKSKDLTNCEEKVQRIIGMAYLRKPTSCNENTRDRIQESTLGTAVYKYALKPLKNIPGLLITKVTSKAVYQFSPFNDEGEASLSETRSWFLDALPAVGNLVSFRFIAERIRKSELTMAEAGQVLVSAMHLVQADQDIMKIAAPLHDYAAAALSTAKEEDLILALKALGNAGRPDSIKPIMKMLPGISSVAPEFLAKVQMDAVMALRNIAEQDPTRIQDIALRMFMDQSLEPEVRMLASVVLLEAKPPLALLATVAEALSRETNLQVASFVYSLMKSLSKSTAPGHERLQYDVRSCSQCLPCEWCNQPHPKVFIFKVQTYLLGKTFEPLEFGIRAEGLEDALMEDNIEPQTTSPSMSIQKVLKLLGRWKHVPSGKTLALIYIKLFGQEVFYARMDKKSIEEMLKVLREPISQYAMVWRVVAMLQQGKTLQLSRPFLLAELRGIFPICIGLPMEMSLVSTTVVTASVTAQVKIIPAPTGESSLAQLLNSEVHISTDGTLGMAVSTIAMVGINTDLIQAGRELHLMAHFITPIKFTTKTDVREGNVRLQFDPCSRETDLLTVRTGAFAVTRNSEDPIADKKILLLPGSTEHYTLKSHFKPEAQHSQGVSDEIMSTKTESPTVERSDHLSTGQNTMCAEAPTFGFRVCLETQSEDANLGDMLLYKVIGLSYLTISLKPAPNSALERVEVEIQTGPKSAAKIIEMTTIAEKPLIAQLKGRVLRQLRGMLTTDKNLGDSVPPLFAIVARARNSDGNLHGYELAVYADTAVSQPRVQILATELGSIVQWKVCIDAEQQNEYKALMAMRWGKDCQEYKMTVEGMTFYKSTVPVPFAIPTDDTQRSYSLAPSLSKTLTTLAKLSKSECIAEGGRFTTFDGVQYMYDMPRGCFHILAQDCLYSPRFMILMKPASVSDRLQVVKVHISNNDIEILPSVSGELRLIYNSHEIPSRNLPFTDTDGEVMVKKEGQGLVLSAERYGLDRVYFSGGRPS
ncbi:hypothetical protein AAFF_G00259160 [Aldrovandia affinis]|uniref:Phosvitin n=1 Tax=Aldrovandia affinis TaxID=143900 RepID=A0AAD7SUM4_9TELE|nr:hypothetical protein AAFF_G00259160 [Aldrovandia affinis]